MSFCRNIGCSNWVLNEGDQCFSCLNKTKFKLSDPFQPDLSYLKINPSYSSTDSEDDHDDDDDDVDELFERAKSAYRRERERERNRIRRNKGYAYDWVQSVIGFLTAILNFFSTVWAACCYISTAVVRHYGFSDDCYYLSVLRRFRDEYILNSGNAERMSDLKRYYEIAPSVVDWIDSQPNAEAIWSDLATTIAESVKAIECGEYDRAYDLYKTRILNLQSYIVN
jgi:hypothetical protein